MTEPDPASAPAAQLRTVILLRHGKSDYPGDTRDFDRPLADRGESEAGEAGRWLRANQPHVDAVLCSSALRTRQTFAATGIVAPARFADELYDASPGEVLDEVRSTGPQVWTLLVVGHAPGMPGLALRLAGPESDAAALDALSTKFPTSAMAVLTLNGEWTDLGPGQAALTAFHIARVSDNGHA